MSTREKLSPFKVITDGSMSGNLTSAVTIISGISMLSYGFSWVGTSPVGTVSVQVSNDYALDVTGAVANAGTWNTLTLNVGGTPATTVAVSGNTGNGGVDIFQTGFYAIRCIYTRASGTGTLQATIAGKVA